ncbi:MAG: hypothetical protein R3B70_14700 [Polyangiaceae bacterium]
MILPSSASGVSDIGSSLATSIRMRRAASVEGGAQPGVAAGEVLDGRARERAERARREERVPRGRLGGERRGEQQIDFSERDRVAVAELLALDRRAVDVRAVLAPEVDDEAAASPRLDAGAAARQAL